MTPYFTDGAVTLYHGDCREVLPGITGVACVTDPPYGETSLEWDRWPAGWPAAVRAGGTRSLWCFGSARMFDTYAADLAGWHMSQDLIWDKGQASMGGVTDRFLRSHEHIRHYYVGAWHEVHHEAQREVVASAKKGRKVRRPATAAAWHGTRNASEWVDDGLRLMLSVLQVPNLTKSALHPTEKPQEVLLPLVRYSCPPGGVIVDPFSGSGSTLLAARTAGRRAVGIEANESYCEIAARRLAQGDLFAEGESA